MDSTTGPRTGEVIDLFAGPGGWSQGLRQHLGIRDVGLELDANACATRGAAGHRTIQADVAAHPTAPFADRTAGLLGSPPCQGFSFAGQRTGMSDIDLITQTMDDLAAGNDTRTVATSAAADPRSLLVVEPLRYALALRPEWVALEQVPAVLPLWQHTAQLLYALGYSTWTGVLNAADYGVPQTRRRAILIASRIRGVAPPAPTHVKDGEDGDLFGPGRPAHVSMAVALGLAADTDVNTRGERKTSGGNNFSADGPSWALTEKARSWKLISRRDSPRWVAEHGARENRSIDVPAPTVTGEAHRWYWQTDEDRARLGVVEAAVLQSFPPDYPFAGSRTARFLQIGNAVPPLLAAHVVSAATGIPLHATLPAALASA